MMMKRTILYLAALASTLPFFTEAGAQSFLEQNQKRDSVLIADQLKYGFSLEEVPEGTSIVLPQFKDTLMQGVEIVGQWKIDTLKVSGNRKKNAKMLKLRPYLTITSFEQGNYILPPLAAIKVSPDGKADTLFFSPETLEVREMPVDTATFQIHDIKGQIRYPVTFKEVAPWLLGAILLAVLVWAAVVLLRRRRQRLDGSIPGEPAHITALRKLDRYRGEKFWEPERQKAFYSGVTDALREYMAARYGVGAMEMTSAEIFDALKETDIPKDLYLEMKDLFERSDMVKFAKFTLPREENAGVLPSAVRFVTSTYQSDIDEEVKDVL